VAAVAGAVAAVADAVVVDAVAAATGSLLRPACGEACVAQAARKGRARMAALRRRVKLIDTVRSSCLCDLATAYAGEAKSPFGSC
jgi:hypothetical protein